MAGRLGDILVRMGRITEAQLQSALSNQGNERGLLGAILLRRGLITIDDLGEALAEQFEVPFTRIVPEALNPQVVRMLPEGFARQHRAAAIEITADRLSLAMVAPDDIATISEAELLTGYSVAPYVALDPDVQAALDRGFDDRIVAQQTIVDMKISDLRSQKDLQELDTNEAIEVEDAPPVIRLVRAVLMGAINAGASDIHLEPHKPEMRIRYRIDGELQQVMTIPSHIEEAVVARIKVMSEMDTTENRRPQDGRLTVQDDGGKVNFRVSTIPTVGGEKVVLRLLDEGNQIFDLEKLGFSSRDLKRLQLLIDKPHGMIVVTGPTGSGKTTTMYAVLSRLNEVQRNIVTVEDPVEYRLPGINQVQSDNEFGLGFANALKYIMRQDPDVIMLGEIRDRETAATAVQAALTGHLMISTLHTNDAVGAVQRLADLGIDSFKIAGSLLGSVAQRLLRRVCQHCKQPSEPSPAMLEALDPHGLIPADTVFYRGRGCRKCVGTGFSGRMPIFEIMLMTEEIVRNIEAGAAHSRLRELAIREGMVELSKAGIHEVIAGNTTLEEVYFKTRA